MLVFSEEYKSLIFYRYNIFNRAKELSDKGFRNLRHTCASLLLNNEKGKVREEEKV